jgi:peptidoglycan/LPS O-acetylase OafA/YrhL
MTTDRFRLIDIVRGLSILAVFWQHMYFERFAGDNSAIDVFGLHIYPFVFNNGFLGVNLFFMVSGFVLFHPRMLQGFEVRSYYLKRALRLWPLYLLLLVVSFTLLHTPLMDALKRTFLLLTGLHDLRPWRWMPPVLWVLWSLGVEILFSLALPLIIFICARFGVVRTAIATLAFCLIYRIVGDQAYYAQFPDYNNPILNPYKDNIFGRLDDFLIGMAMSQMFRDGYRPSRTLCVAAAFAALAASYSWNVIYDAERTLAISTLASFAHPMFTLGCAVLVLRFLGRPLWSWSGFFPIVVLGQSCYSAYLTHAFIIKHFKDSFDFNNALSAIAYLAITIAISVLLFSTVEIIGIGRKPEWWRKMRDFLFREPQTRQSP